MWLQQLRLGVVLWISVQEEQWLKRRRQPVLQVQRSVDSSVLTTRDFRVPSTDSTTVVASPLVCCSFRSETNLPTFFHDVMTRLKKRFWDVSCDLSMTKEILFEFPRYYDTHTLQPVATPSTVLSWHVSHFIAARLFLGAVDFRQLLSRSIKHCRCMSRQIMLERSHKMQRESRVLCPTNLNHIKTSCWSEQ